MTSKKHTKSILIPRPIADVFPLFSPEGEKNWVPGWDYENVMGTTELCEDYVFVTQNHDHKDTNAIWVVKRHDPDSYFVEFYKIEPENKVGVISVKCDALTADTTAVQVTYEYIALSPSGEQFLSKFDENAYDEFIGEWQTLLTAYFQTRG